LEPVEALELMTYRVQAAAAQVKVQMEMILHSIPPTSQRAAVAVVVTVGVEELVVDLENLVVVEAVQVKLITTPLAALQLRLTTRMQPNMEMAAE
jgi:hypothetical protein